ncbi:MAG: putative lipid II flippase FtsW [Patescibacteria group bacterium]|nr:putative lipid II flippase FtsW [Patescibacteria group bacterium]
MVERTASRKADRQFLIYVAILVALGLIALISASAPSGYSKFGDTYYFVKRQIIYGLLPGLFLFLIFARIKSQTWFKLSWPFYIFCLALLILVFIPGVGAAFNKGAHSWLDFGFLHFQPAELAKLAIILILANLLSDPGRDLRDWKNGLLPVLAMVAPSLVLILLQPDIGTLAIMVVVVYAMLYLAKIPKQWLIGLGVLGLTAFLILVVAAPYRMQRLSIFLHPELDPQGIGYHVNQAFLAVGSGGAWGLGYGHSRQKFQYLPEVQADSIFAIVAEEMGFIISSGVVILILLIGWRGLRIAKESSDRFGYLLVSGIVVWFFWQSFVNIGAMVGLLPLTGVTLPFVSHGGTSLMISLAAVGIIASVSRGRVNT